MTDDELIEAMAKAIDVSLYGNKLNAVYCYQEAKAALAVCRPIIERETREKCAKIAEGLSAPYFEDGKLIAEAIREQADDD